MKFINVLSHFMCNRNFKILTFLFSFAIHQLAAQQYDSVEKIMLHHFSFRQAKNKNAKWLKANVPGTVHTDLFKNKIISPPFYADNESDLQWIEQKDWEYKIVFFITDAQLKRSHLLLVFEGLDTYADIYVNDILLGKADNMFCKWEFDIKNKVKKGKNTLRIYFHSPYHYAIPSAKNYAMELPAGNDKGEVKTSVFTRKAPYHYGWDWGPRFATSGIWRPAYILAWDIFKVKNYYFKPVQINEQSATYDIELQLTTSVRGIANCIIKNKQLKFSETFFEIDSGINTLHLPFSIQNPQLWWPNGYGAPNLYNIEIELSFDGQKEIIRHQLGVRTIKLLQQQDSIGESFTFEINGHPMFMKGANYIPMDVFLPEVNKSKKDSLIKMAADCGMNMLRVWGGGIYEDDCFYESCDKYGILIWQDFMFACSLYPWDSSFFKNVKNEAEYNIQRLRNHACLALWCGNNEIDEAWHNWGWQKQYQWDSSAIKQIWRGYKQLFEKLLPEAVINHNAETPYISSSPKIGWGRKESYKSGDSHYWGVWWGMAPFETYKTKVGRFASEYGFQAIPDIFTIKKVIPETDLKLSSSVLASHQKHPTGFQTIDTYMQRYYNKPSNVEDYFYVSQLLQTYGIKMAIEAHRSNKPYCMGTLYWQLNDCWPSVSWSGVDYYLQPKALHYQVKQSFKKFIVTSEYKSNQLQLAVISDSLKNATGDIHLKLMDFKGNVKWQYMHTIFIKANDVSRYCIPIKDNLLFKDSANLLLHISLDIANQNAYENKMYFCAPKYLNLLEAKINIAAIPISEGVYYIRCSSPVFVKNLYIYSDIPGTYSDNYFDLLPHQEKIVVFKSSAGAMPTFKTKCLNLIH